MTGIIKVSIGKCCHPQPSAAADIYIYIYIYIYILDIQLTISFLIGRKRTVKFRNQRLGPHLAADYTIIKSRTLKVSGNHVVYDRGAWFLRVIISSLRTLCRLSSVKKQRSKNRTSRSCFVDPARHRKNSWRKELTNAKRSTKVAKELFADHVKEKKLREPEVFLPV